MESPNPNLLGVFTHIVSTPLGDAVSDEDRQRWNERYREGAYQFREHPSAVLLDWQDALAGSTAPVSYTHLTLPTNREV